MEGRNLKNVACAMLLALCLAAPSAAFADSTGSTDVTLVVAGCQPGQVTREVDVSQQYAGASARTGDTNQLLGLLALAGVAGSSAALLAMESARKQD